MKTTAPAICSHRDIGLDQKALAELLVRLDPYFRPQLHERFEFGPYAGKLLRHAEMLVALVGDDVAGFIAVYANDGVTRRAHIPLVAVFPAHRGRGLARALLGGAVALAAGRGMRSVSLEHDPGNATARRIYEAFGFREVGRDEAKVSMLYEIESAAPRLGAARNG